MRTIFSAAFAIFISLGSALAQTPTPTPPPVDAATDIAFWNSVKDSRQPAELKAYLDKFPQGTFAELARVRLKALNEAAAAPKATPPASAAPAPAQPTPNATALATPDIVREVQTKLYNLNFSVKNRTGRIDGETRAAIKSWQANLKRPETGDLTQAELAMLRAAEVPVIWGAIGYNVAGGSSSHWNVATRERAEMLALEGCRKHNGGSCDTITAARTACMVVSYASGVVGSTRYSNAYAIVRPTLGAATDHALSECRRLSKVPSQCGIRTTACADGGHKR